MDWERRLLWSALLAAVTSLVVFGIMKHTVMHNIYVNVVWGKVESISHDIRTDQDMMTVLFSTDEADYAGTYRIKVTNSEFNAVDDEVLLMATEDYSRAKLYDPQVFAGTESKDISVATKETNHVAVSSTDLLDSFEEFFDIATKVFLAVMAVMLALWMCTLIVIACDKPRKMKQKLNACDYIRPSERNTLLQCISDMHKLYKSCPSKTFKQMFKDILAQMYRRVDYLTKIDKVVVDTSKDKMSSTVEDTLNLFKDIASLGSTQVFDAATEDLNSGIAELQKKLYQLKAWQELK